tara:strand:- start:37 stop:687 length:651 start_codon:yes stop_codon:yes gene_type:complete
METFDPVKYSLAENAFFLKHLGESPLAVLQKPLPDGVNKSAVEQALGRVYELAQLEEHRGTTWAGIERVSEAISRYLIEREKWAEFSSRGAPTFPSMFAWDGKGKPHRGGVGSDAGQVNTYFVDGGKRKPFAIPLVEVAMEAFAAPWSPKEEEVIPDACVEDAEKGVMSCPIDGFSTNWNPESRQAYNLARARMARHCRSSKDPRVQEFGLKVFSR